MFSRGKSRSFAAIAFATASVVLTARALAGSAEMECSGYCTDKKCTPPYGKICCCCKVGTVYDCVPRFAVDCTAGNGCQKMN
ncbi:MAG: hypothetical protein K2Q09_01610 [Phycisphaerales bacterium]|nr:hypothetical protein [Phycisphaerales bacterium]